MAKVPYQSLSESDRRDALAVTASRIGRPAYLMEKDIWVVQTLQILFSAAFGKDLVFKGGTSLSKAYGVIRRFSEDIDITYDIRAFAPELTGGSQEPLPVSRSQEQRWTRAIRSELAMWTREQALPVLQAGLAEGGFAAEPRAEHDRIFLRYGPIFGVSGFVRPEVMVEFGARSTGDPRTTRLVECEAAVHLPEIAFPTASPSVMLAVRTFWEKATAMHVFCRQQRQRGQRLSRHWHDVVRLDDAGYADLAIADRPLALSVARHKAKFFAEKDVDGRWIDYEAAVTGDLQLVPTGRAYDALAEDYERMLVGGMLLDDEERFDEIARRCADIEARANGALKRMTDSS